MRGRGQSLVEFAFVLPALLLVLFALIDGGRFVFATNELGNAVRQGARAGIVRDYADAQCQGLTRDQCAAAITRRQLIAMPGSPVVTVSCSTDPCRPGALYTVTAATVVTFLTPAVGQYLGPRPISASVVMRVES
jgi:Flp pilus assembly protein TadG